MKKLSKVEQCIAWAAQHGYVDAQDAADEYGRQVGREMVEDYNTALYNTRSWRDASYEHYEPLGRAEDRQDMKGLPMRNMRDFDKL